MHKIDLIVLIAVVSYMGYRIYQKYFKKEVPGGKSPGTDEGDDYEPYSNK